MLLAGRQVEKWRKNNKDNIQPVEVRGEKFPVSKSHPLGTMNIYVTNFRGTIKDLWRYLILDQIGGYSTQDSVHLNLCLCSRMLLSQPSVNESGLNMLKGLIVSNLWIRSFLERVPDCFGTSAMSWNESLAFIIYPLFAITPCAISVLIPASGHDDNDHDD